MPTLIGLPNEILTAIIEVIEPDDIESFSTCCKLIHCLARQRLEEHQHKKSLYSKVLVSGSTLPYPKPFQGEEYHTQLQGLFLDKRNRSYTKAMVVEFFPASTADVVNKLDGFELQLESSMREVHKKIGLETGGIKAKKWVKQLKKGNPGAMLLFLLALLPNLESFSIDHSAVWPLSARFSNIFSLMTKAALEQSKDEPSFGGKLTKCTLHGEECVGLENELLTFLMMLPRIQVLQGYRLSIREFSWPYAEAMSPIADLELHGEMDACTLSRYLSCIRQLKRFRYTHFSDGYISFKPFKIVATLRQSALKSLVHLDLTTDAPYEMTWTYGLSGIGSLRSFEVLETIRLQYNLLLGDARDANSPDVFYLKQTSPVLFGALEVRGQRLIDFLPSSARTFRLEGIAKRRPVLSFFKDFPEHKVERLPKLESISLDAGDELNTQIEKICRESGVQIEISLPGVFLRDP